MLTRLFRKKTIFTGSLGYGTTALTELPEDFYQLIIELDYDTITEFFYVGDLQKQYNIYEQEIANINYSNKQDYESLQAALKRLKYLLNKKPRINSHSEIQFTHKNIVNTAFTIRNLLERAKVNNSNFFKNANDTYIRSYTSSIDSKQQHYMFHASKEVLESELIPLVVIMPFFHNPLDSMLTSWYLSNYDQIEWEKKLADEHGVALFWPYLRGNTGISPIGNIDFFEALADVQQNYQIDPDRIYLMGDCAGATRSMMLASRYPDMFAAVSLFQPELKQQTDNLNPMNFVGNISNIPVYVYHSTKDEITDVSNSDDFVAEAHKYNFHPHYDRSNRDSHYLLPKDCHKPIFEFFKDKRRNINPDTIFYTTFEQKYNTAYWITIEEFEYIGKTKIEAKVNSTSNEIHINAVNIAKLSLNISQTTLNPKRNISIYVNDAEKYSGKYKDQVTLNLSETLKNEVQKNSKLEGPIYDFFTDKFVYVESDQGNSIANQITDLWGKHVFFNLNTIHEKELEKYINSHNLILYNESYSSAAVQKILSQLPIQQKNNSFKFRNTKIRNQNTSFCAIYPNPYNSTKYILYIGTNNKNDFQLIGKNQIIKGTYDYIIWENVYESNYITEEGYFNMNWQ
jgi:hypothetical protein